MTKGGSHNPCPLIGERATLTGWAAVENEMLKHDESTMEGHLKDMDTLLVFAGLFSAVLTAFVVESYQQLQLDTGTVSMLMLRRISIQFESFSLSPGFANSSASAPPLPPLEFVADPTARWINVLWFLSLIFSLAAALFGILVKQWIREYMQWNAALASPRDNVLVRQIRFEAWNKWNVPATIATIPALLEVALVLFVCGLVTLLWTLDPVVSIVITTAIAIFLAIASTFTILPAFFERCPYKSPTAWACAIVWDFVTLWIPHAISPSLDWLGRRLWLGNHNNSAEALGAWLQKISGLKNLQLGDWTAISRNWRARDLANLRSSFAPRSNLKRGDATALLDALLSEQSCADGSHRCAQERAPAALQLRYDARAAVQPPLLDALRTITELPPLIRALAWVSQASQSPLTQGSVLHCVESLESRFLLPEPMVPTDQGGFALTQEGVRAVSIWHLLSSFGLGGGSAAAGRQVDLEDVPSFRASVMRRSMYPRPCGEAGDALFSVGSHRVLYYAEQCRPAVSLFVYLTSLSFESAIGALQALPNSENTPENSCSARRAMELLTVLYSFYGLNKNDSSIPQAVECLVSATRATSGERRELFESRYPNLRHCILIVARRLHARWPAELEAEFWGLVRVARPVLDSRNLRSDSSDPGQSSDKEQRNIMVPPHLSSEGLEGQQISPGDGVQAALHATQVAPLPPDPVEIALLASNTSSPPPRPQL